MRETAPNSLLSFHPERTTSFRHTNAPTKTPTAKKKRSPEANQRNHPKCEHQSGEPSRARPKTGSSPSTTSLPSAVAPARRSTRASRLSRGPQVQAQGEGQGQAQVQAQVGGNLIGLGGSAARGRARERAAAPLTVREEAEAHRRLQLSGGPRAFGHAGRGRQRGGRGDCSASCRRLHTDRDERQPDLADLAQRRPPRLQDGPDRAQQRRQREQRLMCREPLRRRRAAERRHQRRLEPDHRP